MARRRGEGAARPLPRTVAAPFWAGVAGVVDLAALVVTRSPAGAAYGVAHTVTLLAALAIAAWGGWEAEREERSALQAGAVTLAVYAAVSGVGLFLTTFVAAPPTVAPSGGSEAAAYLVGVVVAALAGSGCGLVGRVARGRGPRPPEA